MLLNFKYLVAQVSMHCIAVAGGERGGGAQESEIRVFRMLPAAAPASAMVKKDGPIVAALFGPPAAFEGGKVRYSNYMRRARTLRAASPATPPARST